MSLCAQMTQQPLLTTLAPFSTLSYRRTTMLCINNKKEIEKIADLQAHKGSSVVSLYMSLGKHLNIFAFNDMPVKPNHKGL